MATLLEKAKKLGAEIDKRKLGSYAVHRVTCSACPWMGTRNDQTGGNYNIKAIYPSMNAHARKHIAAAKKGETLKPPKHWRPPAPPPPPPLLRTRTSK